MGAKLMAVLAESEEARNVGNTAAAGARPWRPWLFALDWKSEVRSAEG
jgi:hypothetical protein